ncbi:Coenzyme F420 hydrogenase/dehydrogenase, beta subunit C-terminal domain [Vibrio nomapromontoriensis]|uniref:Coenzyme F420 hydrogenase/dehydrogenase, beta subunit C-terminal domain n=1 Tax=Vibrio nomapromontoriensis TaxID=2910246 RepID=UPI003D0A05A5
MKNIKEVMASDMCYGCGACVKGGNTVMQENEKGFFVPQEVDKSKFKEFCGMSDSSMTEDKIVDLKKEKWDSLQECKAIGFYKNIYLGYGLDYKERFGSSGGGILTELLVELLGNHTIDYVVHVGPTNSSFGYKISKTESDIRGNKKSHYYPCPMNEVLEEIRNQKGKFVFVGIPCIVSTFNRIIQKDESLRANCKYTFGIVCGHLKSTLFADYIINRTKKNTSKKVDRVIYRESDSLARANEYRMGVLYEDGSKDTKPVMNIPGTNWGESYFKMNSCDYCDDIYNETADIVFGDAWLKDYIKSGDGANIIVVRDGYLDNVLVNMMEAGKIFLTDGDESDALKAQDATIRHRTDGLSYRLYKRKSKNLWSPKKRVAPDNNWDYHQKRIWDMREEMTLKSALYYNASSSMFLFDMKMWKLRREYFNLYKPKKYKYIPVELYRLLQHVKSALLKVWKGMNKSKH